MLKLNKPTVVFISDHFENYKKKNLKSQMGAPKKLLSIDLQNKTLLCCIFGLFFHIYKVEIFDFPNNRSWMYEIAKVSYFFEFIGIAVHLPAFFGILNGKLHYLTPMVVFYLNQVVEHIAGFCTSLNALYYVGIEFGRPELLKTFAIWILIEITILFLIIMKARDFANNDEACVNNENVNISKLIGYGAGTVGLLLSIFAYINLEAVLIHFTHVSKFNEFQQSSLYLKISLISHISLFYGLFTERSKWIIPCIAYHINSLVGNLKWTAAYSMLPNGIFSHFEHVVMTFVASMILVLIVESRKQLERQCDDGEKESPINKLH